MTKTKTTVLSVECPRKDCEAPRRTKCRRWETGKGFVELKRAHTERMQLTVRQGVSTGS
jgi:hypothetical protein